MDPRNRAQIQGDAVFLGHVGQGLELVGGQHHDGGVAEGDPVGFHIGADLVLNAVVRDAAFLLQGGQQVEDVGQGSGVAFKGEAGAVHAVEVVANLPLGEHGVGQGVVLQGGDGGVAGLLMDGPAGSREIIPGPGVGGIGHAALVEDGGVVGEAAGVGAVGHAGDVAVGLVLGGGDHGVADGGGVDGAILDVGIQGLDGIIIGEPVVAHLEHIGQGVSRLLGLELGPVAGAVEELVLDVQAGQLLIQLDQLDGLLGAGVGAPPHDGHLLSGVIRELIAFGVDVVPAFSLLGKGGEHETHRQGKGKQHNQEFFHGTPP